MAKKGKHIYWDDKMTEILLREYANGAPIRDIAEMLGVPKHSIDYRLRKFGVKRHNTEKRNCKNPKCAVVFKPNSRIQVYCCKKCEQAHRRALERKRLKTIREYSNTSNMLIVTMLDEGHSIGTIAETLNRDKDDLKRHVTELFNTDKPDKIRSELAWHKKKGLPNGSYW